MNRPANHPSGTGRAAPRLAMPGAPVDELQTQSHVHVIWSQTGTPVLPKLTRTNLSVVDPHGSSQHHWRMGTPYRALWCCSGSSSGPGTEVASRLVPTLRQRLVGAAWSLPSSSKSLRLRWLTGIERSGPVHRLLRGFYRFSRRHPVAVSQWDAQYAGDYGDRLGSVNEVTHHMVIVGYLAYGAKTPTVLDVGCGHGRFVQLLNGFGFSKYVGIDWSAEAIEQAQSLSIPQTQFEVADMDHWDTSDRFDAVVLNESLYYSAVDPRQLFDRTLGWLAEDGIVIVSMFRNFGSRYIWSEIQSDGVEQLAACEVKDNTTGKVWDVKALRPRSASLTSHSP